MNTYVQQNQFKKKGHGASLLYFLFSPNLRSIGLVPDSQLGLPNYYINISEEVKNEIINNRIIYQKYLILPDEFSKFWQSGFVTKNPYFFNESTFEQAYWTFVFEATIELNSLKPFFCKYVPLLKYFTSFAIQLHTCTLMYLVKSTKFVRTLFEKLGLGLFFLINNFTPQSRSLSTNWVSLNKSV